jgi:DNA replication regulator DPB11
MGAEHKLDLTSDVTHLLVGDTDTPKYKYVAKEREDVKVLRPEWVEAVRTQWMEAKTIDLEALHQEYRMPTLAGTKICITGFDDLPFRARLHQNVIENGGTYTGDLTRDVTHLIARKPEGKKYEYGMQWQKKIVTLQWYKETLERGMQLEESTYHPTVPQDEQGRGAWNRTTQSSPNPSKRARADQQGPEPARKLRRIASARLHSQTDNMWSDLTGVHAGSLDVPTTRATLKPTQSMPDLRDASTDLGPNKDSRKDSFRGDAQIFTAKYFAVQGFPPDRARILRDVISNNGGNLLESVAQLRQFEGATADAKVLLVPYQTPAEQVPSPEEASLRFHVASELWVEHCMFCKLFTPPDQYPLSQFVPKIKPPGLSKLVVTSTGFSGIVPNHVDKIVRLLGAKYEQTFTRNTSVLVCNRKNQNKTKLAMAKSWSIPVVAESWLWACVKENRRPSFEAHALYLPRPPAAEKVEPKKSSVPSKERSSFADTKTTHNDSRSVLVGINLGAKKGTSKIPTKKVTAEHPGSEFLVRGDDEAPCMLLHDDAGIHDNPGEHGEQAEQTHALQPISHNSSPKRQVQPVAKPKKRLFQTLDGPSSDVENQEVSAEDDHATAPPNAVADVTDAQSLNSEIQELLNMKTKLRAKSDEGRTTEKQPKKKLMGRALSNLSNSSSTSNVRPSRASSVDSVNTDGIGSEVGPCAPLKSKMGENAEGGHSFMGRAKSKMSEGQSVTAVTDALAAYDAEDQQWAEEAAAPALTQLRYEDPEEALELREILAAKRRQRSKLGQKESDPKPAVRKFEEPKRIRDDELVMGNGWGGGRRTRQKDKPVQEL